MSGNARIGGKGRRMTHTPLDMIAWNVTTEHGMSDTVYTLGCAPKGYRKATLVE